MFVLKRDDVLHIVFTEEVFCQPRLVLNREKVNSLVLMPSQPWWLYLGGAESGGSRNEESAKKGLPLPFHIACKNQIKST